MNGKGMTVIIAEETMDPTGLLGQFISMFCQNVTIVYVNNGERALAEFSAHKGAVDLLVVDANLPKFGGAELTKQVRRLYPKTFVFLMGGQVVKGHEAHVFSLKPLDVPAFGRTLQGLSSKKK